MRSIALLLVALAVCHAFKVPVRDGVPLGRKQANIPLPATSLLSSGYNTLTGQANLLPVFQLTYTKGKTWNPPYSPGITYNVPDQIVASATGEQAEIIVQDVYDHYQEFLKTYRSSFSVSAGIGGNSWGLAAKYDHELMRVQLNLANQSIAQGYSKHWWSLYQAEALPPFLMTLDSEFQAVVSSLPSTIKSAADAAKYDQFFQYWGTHYVSMANFGAYVHMDSFVNKLLIDKYSMQWVSNQMSLDFHYKLFNISGGGFTNKSSIHIDNTYTQHSSTYVFFEGGDQSLASINTLSAWVASIESSPHYLNATLRPLSELPSDATTKATMLNALNSFVAHNGTVALVDFVSFAPVPSAEVVVPAEEPAQELAQEPAQLAPIYGSDIVGCGYDASTDTFGLLPVVSYTYKEGKTWQNPVYPQYSFAIPDQFVIQNLPESFLLDGSYNEQTSADYSYTFEQKTHSRHCGLFGCSSKSKDLKEYYNYYYGENRSMTVSIKYISWYQLTSVPLPPPTPDPAFTAVINALPQVYTSSPSAKTMYQEFIKSYGTDYVTEAVFGGMIINKEWYHSCMEKEYSQVWLQTQASYSFFGILGNGHGKTYNDTRVSAAYANDRLSATEIFGGNTALQASQWADWIPTVKTSPFPLTYLVLPFSALISDPIKANSMEQAITDYMSAQAASAQQLIKQISSQNNNHNIPAVCK